MMNACLCLLNNFWRVRGGSGQHRNMAGYTYSCRVVHLLYCIYYSDAKTATLKFMKLSPHIFKFTFS